MMLYLTTHNRVTASRRTLALGLLLAALLAASVLLAAKPAHATTTFTVDRTDDPDPATANACTDAPSDCSLRGAIVAANAATGADAITVPAGVYTLTRAGDSEDAASTGDLDVTDELTITGAGARTTSVVGGPAPYDDRIFDNRPGAKATITGLTITGGKPGGYEGGGVRNRGDLTLERVAVEDNTAGGGGGIDSREGYLTLDGVTVKGNTSDFAGGIYSEKGALTLTDSTVSGNKSAGSVGGISSYEGTLNLTDSTISGNSATVNGGGVAQISGTANITNTTISGNKSANFAGGFAAESDAVVNIRNSTIASNESDRLGGGILTTTRATVFVKNTIVSGNTEDNCNDVQFGGDISSQGNNISSDESCPFTKTTDKRNTNPLLGPLANNGGPTDTRALLSGSPAIDAGSNTGCPETDQRGVRRPQNGDGNRSAICDIGAFERDDLTPPKVTTTVPSASKTGVKRNTNLTATFSEQMDRATLTKSTFKLFKVSRDGSTTQINGVSVRSTEDGLKAILNPDGTLATNTKYQAVVSTGAKDVAGNRLDQDRKLSNNQPMKWFFTTGSS